MKNINFDYRISKKANELLKAKNDALKNKDKNKRKLKSRIIRESKQYMLLLTPKLLGEETVEFKGRIYEIVKTEDKYIFEIDKGNMKKAVLFDSFDEIRALAEEIKNETSFDIKYELKEYKSIAYLTFYYYYKKN